MKKQVKSISMQKKLTSNDIINFLRAEKTFLNRRYGVIEIGLFGSFANGAPTEESDIDLVIELKEPRFEYLAGLQIFLENKFNKKVEIIRKSEKVKSRFLRKIEDKIIYA